MPLLTLVVGESVGRRSGAGTVGHTPGAPTGCLLCRAHELGNREGMEWVRRCPDHGVEHLGESECSCVLPPPLPRPEGAGCALRSPPVVSTSYSALLFKIFASYAHESHSFRFQLRDDQSRQHKNASKPVDWTNVGRYFTNV